MPIGQLESKLGAVFVGEYPPGHMGSRLLRYRRNADSAQLVVKYAANGNLDAQADLGANLHGYLEIAKLGAGYINPPGLREITIRGGRAIVMRDLGLSVRNSASGAATWRQVVRCIERTTRDTLRDVSHDYVGEVLSKISQYAPDVARRLRLRQFRRSPKSSLMLLDFTPDNVFAGAKDVFFLDPWRQSTYLGHPAVSLGQFTRLLSIYGLDGHLRARHLMRQSSAKISKMLTCHDEGGDEAFRLGETLQLVLSAHVRKAACPKIALQFEAEALAIWN